ncbi:MAG: DMT family transporter [Muribaculaceae bacterium]|nr:DMT family transporter [Muribaculaceae bacterium]
MKLKGFLLGIFAAAAYGSIPLFTIPLYNEGMTVNSALFWRYLLAIPVMAIFMIARKESFKINSLKEGLLLAGAGIIVGLSSVCLFQSYKYMDVGIASTLLFVYPVLVALIMASFFKERMKLYSWLFLAGTIVGIGMLCKTSGGRTISTIGLIMISLSSLFYAIYIVGVNRTSLARLSSLKVIFYLLTFGLLVFIIAIACQGSFQIPSSFQSWGNAIGLAIIPTALSFWLTTLAIQHIGATNTAILGAFEPVTGVLVSLFAFHGVLSPRETVGIILILVCVTMITAGPALPHIFNRKHHLPPKR